MIPKFITAALAGQQPRIFGDGTQSRDFCYIDNVVEANLRRRQRRAAQASGRVFNVGCGAAIDLNQRRRADRRHPGHRSSRPTYEPERAGDIKHSLADIGAARAAPRLQRRGLVRRGLRRTIDWYKSESRELSA